MRIPKLNMRKKRGRKSGSPLKYDPTLINFLAQLQAIDNYNSFETWRKEFLGRMSYFLIDESIERSEEAYHVRLRVKVDKLVRVVAKIAHNVNSGSLSSKQVTIQSHNSLNEGMKSCEDISSYLKELSPLTMIEEKDVGFTKYNIVAVLVEDSFKEYERLNMCRDILQVLRENFLNSIADPDHLAAFDKYEQEIDSFKSIILDDVGLLPVLRKQRQLKSPEPPKALIVEIRRGVLREALISKSIKAKQAAKANKDAQKVFDTNPTGKKSKLERNRADFGLEKNGANLYPGVSQNIGNASDVNAIEENSISDMKQDFRKTPVAIQNRFEIHPSNERIQPRRRREKVNGQSPSKRQPTKNLPRRILKQPIDDNLETNQSQSHSRRLKKSKSPARDSSDLFTPLDKNSKSKSKDGKRSSALDSNSTNIVLIQGKGDYWKSKGLLSYPKEGESSIDMLSEDDKSKPSIYKKNKPKIRAKKARNGKQSLKSSARDRNIVTARRGRDVLRKNEISVHDAKQNIKTINDDLKFENLDKESTLIGNDDKISTRNTRHIKSPNHNRAYIGSTGTKLKLESDWTSIQIDSLRPNHNVDYSKARLNRLKNDRIPFAEVQKKKKMVYSKASRRKKNPWSADDYKKIIHGKTYSLNTEKESPKLNIKRPYPVLVSNDIFWQEKSKQSENSPVGNNLGGPNFEKLQLKPGEKISLNALSSLLDNFSRLDQEESELGAIQNHPLTEGNETSNTNGGIFEGLQSFKYGGNRSASMSPDRSMPEEEKVVKQVAFEDKNLFEKRSFYENFVKPLTMVESGSKYHKEGEVFRMNKERLEWGKDIFEDSVCSSRYVCKHSSLSDAIAKFKSEESIKELQRLNRVLKEEDEIYIENNEGDSEKKSSSVPLNRNDNSMLIDVTAKNQIIEEKKPSAQKTKEVKSRNQFGSEADFFENNEEYGIYEQTKEILTAEEEAARMADEVAKLQIALEDNRHEFDYPDLDDEEEQGVTVSDEGTWRKFIEGEESLIIKKMLKLEVSKVKPKETKTLSYHTEGEHLEAAETPHKLEASGGGIFEKVVLSPTHFGKIHSKTENLEIEGKMLELNSNKYERMQKGEHLLEQYEELHYEAEKLGVLKLENDEGEKTEIEEKSCIKSGEFRFEDEELEMVEKMLKLEAFEGEQLEKEVETSFCFGRSHFEEIKRASSKKSEDTSTRKIGVGEEVMETGLALLSEDSCPLYTDFEESNGQPSETSAHLPSSSFTSSNTMSTYPSSINPSNNELLTLTISEKFQTNEIGDSSCHNNTFEIVKGRMNKGNITGRSVRVYDPSATLSRWQTPLGSKVK